MPPQGQGEIARQWFIPGEGIDRHVISTDLQRYLGNDATVRPGKGSEGHNQGVEGYWIKAYRNLTSPMIADLRADSSRWRQEQRSTGTRAPYVQSDTYQQATAAMSQRRDRDSPSMDIPPYGAPPGRGARPADPMQIDPQPPVGQYGAQPPRPGYGPDGRPYADPRGGYPPQQDRNQYPQDRPMPDQYARQPANQPYQDPRYPPNYPPQNGPPAGYYQNDNYGTSTGPYQPGMPATRGPEPSRYPPGYDQPQVPPGGRDPRAAQPAYGQPGYEDPRFAQNAYPSPAATVVHPRDPRDPRDPRSMASPQQDPYGAASPYEYGGGGGRPVQPPYGGPDPGYQQPREPAYEPQRDSRRAPAPANDRGDRRRRN